MSARRRCVFCRNEGSSSEHVFARWISRIVRGEGGVGFTHASDDPRHRQRAAKIIDIRTNVACANCNSSWMSDLEDRARVLPAGPIRGESRSYTATEQISVAGWAFKTALMLDCTWPGRIIPQGQFRHPYRSAFHHPACTSGSWPTPQRRVRSFVVLGRSGLD